MPKNSKVTKKNARKFKKKSYQTPQKPLCCKAEYKNIDTSAILALFPNNGSSGSWSIPILLNQITPGTGASQRVGRKVDLASLLLRTTMFTVPVGGGGVNASCVPQWRVLVVYDSQTNGLASNIATIVQDVAFTESPMNLGNSERYKVILDQTQNIDGAATFIQAGSILSEPIYRKLKRMDMLHNNGNTGTITDITKGAVWMCVSSNITNANSPNLAYYARIRYTDS